MNQELLIVEDEELINRYLSEKLTESGYTVHSAHNGLDALEIIKSAKVSLIITDVVMPRMDGVELCRQLRRIDGEQKTPVIASTAWANKEKQLRDCGVQHFIFKPYDFASLNDLVKKILNPPKAMSITRRVLAVGDNSRAVDETIASMQLDCWPLEYRFLPYEEAGTETLLKVLREHKPDLVLVDNQLGAEKVEKMIGKIYAFSSPLKPFLAVFNQNRLGPSVLDRRHPLLPGEKDILFLEKLDKTNLALIIFEFFG